MGESKKRLGRTYGYRLGIGSAVTAIALVMVLTPLAGATTVVHAPYKGGVSSGYYDSANGCALAKINTPAKFSLLTGKGGLGVATATAKVCKAVFAGVGQYSYGDTENNLNLAIQLHMTSGYHTVNANANAIWAASDHFTQGSGCPAPKAFKNSYSYAPPNATYAYWDNYSGAQSYCQGYASVGGWIEEAYILDITNGTQIAASSGCLYSYFCDLQMFNNYSENYTDMGWEFYNYTTYYSGSFHYSAGSYSLNYSYHTPGTSFSSSGSTPASLDFNYTYVGSHHYALVLYMYAYADSSAEGWIGGGTSVSTFNVGTLGNGFTLNNVIIS